MASLLQQKYVNFVLDVVQCLAVVFPACHLYKSNIPLGVVNTSLSDSSSIFSLAHFHRDTGSRVLSSGFE